MFRRRPVPIVSRTVALVFGLLVAIATVPLVVPILPLDNVLREGDRAPRTLEARHDATYPSDVLTEDARRQAAANVADIYLPPDPSIRQQQSDKLKLFLDQVRAIRMRTDLSSQQQLVEIGNLSGAASVSAGGRANLVAVEKAGFDSFSLRAQRALVDILEAGVKQADLPQRVDDFLGVPANAPPTAVELTALREVLRVFVIPNVQADDEATQRARDAARANAAVVYQTYTRGQVIVTEGQVLKAGDIEALKATGIVEGSLNLPDMGAGVILSLSFGLVLAVFVFQLQPFPAPAKRRLVLAGMVVVAALAATRVYLPQVTPDTDHHYLAFAVPLAAVAMLVASFADLAFAAVVAVAVSFFATFAGATAPDLAGATFVGPLEALELAVVYTAGGLTGAVAVYRAERLTRYAASGVAVAVASWLVLVAFWLIGDSQDTGALAWLTLASALSGVFAAVLTIGLSVLLSMALGVTTRLQIMELIQSGHPLLLRLQTEAPGTYHHSLMIGALAEPAATRIGADALVVRAGAYYHDVGKLVQPSYFIENMLDGAPSPHDQLDPVESARRIRDHVSNGLDVARKYRLPQLVRDFIPQHHGTRLVTYFYRRAIQQGATADPADFRYPGPRPQTKEAAIVMLADSCEATVRARADRDQAHMDELVDGIVAERLAEGQLDECDVTMRELQQVAASFKSTLRAIYHPRIEYPAAATDEVAIIARLAEGADPERPPSAESA